jgi:hypothetical protein
MEESLPVKNTTLLRIRSKGLRVNVNQETSRGKICSVVN